MANIYETDNFVVEARDMPHISREEGGHIRIITKEYFKDRTELSPELATELIRLSMVIGKAMKIGLTKRGIKIIRINYQENGNWAFKSKSKPFFHLHVYGRVKDAKVQVFPEAIYLPDRSAGFYKKFKPLNKGDIKQIQVEIKKLVNKGKFKEENW